MEYSLFYDVYNTYSCLQFRSIKISEAIIELLNDILIVIAIFGGLGITKLHSMPLVCRFFHGAHLFIFVGLHCLRLFVFRLGSAVL